MALPDLTTLRARARQGGPIDRASVDAARQMLAQVLEPDQVAPFLQLLRAYIDPAHAVAPGSWTLTLVPRGLRMTVGRIQVVELLPEALWVLVPQGSPAHQLLAAHAMEPGGFSTLQVPYRRLVVPHTDLSPEAWALLASGAEAIAIGAARTARMTPVRKAWSGGMGRVLAETDPSCPRPVWQAEVEQLQAEGSPDLAASYRGIPASAWRDALWSWIASSVEEAAQEPAWRLYWSRQTDSELYVNARIASGRLRVDVDDHLLALVESVPPAFVERLKSNRYRKTWSTGAAEIRRAKGTTVSPTTAAHTALIPHGAPGRTTVSLNVYRWLYIDLDELTSILPDDRAATLRQLHADGNLPAPFSQLELAIALGLLDDLVTEESDQPVDPTDPPEGDEDDAEDETTNDDAWEHHRNVIFFGPPGTGKSYELAALVRDHLKAAPDDVFRITFHPETSYFDFVGTYKPVVGWLRTVNTFTGHDGRGDASREPRVYYAFDPGPFSLALARALRHPEQRVVLVIEEINRGNCAAVFGDVFQLLDRAREDRADAPYGTSEYPIFPSSDWARWLDEQVGDTSPFWKAKRLRLPPNLYLYATMNTSDQSLFPMDTAFRRRWGLRYHGVTPKRSIATRVQRHGLDHQGILWTDLMRALNRVIVEHTRSDDKQVGPWYLRPGMDSDLVPAVEFRSKVLFYLWSDVFRDATTRVFRDDIRTYDALLRRYDAGEHVFRQEVLDAVLNG